MGLTLNSTGNKASKTELVINKKSDNESFQCPMISIPLPEMESFRLISILSLSKA